VTSPARLVLDSGPLIALFHAGDRDHERAVAGFRQLTADRAAMIAPLPVVFEVYKWLLFEATYAAAQRGLSGMRRALEIVYPLRDEFAAAATLAGAIRRWGGTLEDAVVAVTALRLQLPVWTLNFRDLGALPELEFWTPS
jgi:predicted nucleic acid-binding protein